MLAENSDTMGYDSRMRRYARALAGEAQFGNVLWRQAMQALRTRRSHGTLPPDAVAIYREISRVWRALGDSTRLSSSEPARCHGAEQRRIARMSPRPREAFLLTAMESLSARDCGVILGASEAEVLGLLRQAREEAGSDDAASICIIEDEFLIAKELEHIVQELGHKVAGRARTREAARDLIRTAEPDLILADIQLADDSSGIDAVNDVLAELGETPVIFITAYPARLICPDRPAPTFLVNKPYDPRDIRAAITQTLYFGTKSALNPLQKEDCGPPLVRFG
jgi:CheY-like chemotaxis protein